MFFFELISFSRMVSHHPILGQIGFEIGKVRLAVNRLTAYFSHVVATGGYKKDDGKPDVVGDEIKADK